MLSLVYKKTHTVVFAGLLLLALTLTVNSASQDEFESKIEEARTQLRASQAKAERVASDLEKLKSSGNADPEIVKDYETYLSSAQAMVNQNQKIVDDMEEAYSKYKENAQSPGCSQSAQKESARNKESPAIKKTSQATMSDSEQDRKVDHGLVSEQDRKLDSERGIESDHELDRELDDSLAAFDEMLLKEMEDIRAQSENKMRDLAEEAAAAERRLKDKGVDVSGSSEEAGSDEEGKDQKKGDGEKEQGGSYEESPGTDKRYDGSRPGEGSTSGQRGKPPYGSEQDDDIVARQLREAAEKETDPVLKEKLWKEYEDYKRSTR